MMVLVLVWVKIRFCLHIKLICTNKVFSSVLTRFFQKIYNVSP